LRAFKLLYGPFHVAGFVFGDLRLPNVLVSAEGRLALVDFDWSGEAGNACYPLGLNEDEELG
jgi:thiamine kinase-like enzyme